jgi:threonine/homoserine/homoserine lactone efflux protein
VITGSLLAYLGVAFLVIATPGQDTALTVRNTLTGGRWAGLSTALGICAGQSIWAVSASAGLGAIIVASEPALMTLRLLGSGFLVFLGVRTVLGARSLGPEATRPDSSASVQLSVWFALRQGFVSNLLNPKMVAFFASLLPQFADSVTTLLALGLVFSLMTMTWLSGYTLAVVKMASILRRPRVKHAIEVVTGVVLIALGTRLAMGGWR